MTQEKIFLFLLYMPGFLFSLSFHEAAHAWMANRLGDATARLRGRMTLNPAPHIDPIGTLVMPLIGFFSGFPIIAWAKPVPFDPRNLKNVRRDSMLIALAGPLSNLLLAAIWAFLIKGFPHAVPFLSGVFSQFVLELIYATLVMVFFLNLALCLFNFLPIDPLDGGKILRGILPHALAVRFDMFMHRSGQMLNWIFLILIFTGLFRRVFVPVLMALAQLFLGKDFDF